MRFLKALGEGEVLYMQEERDGGGTNTKYRVLTGCPRGPVAPFKETHSHEYKMDLR